jgi:hypothetical protein
MVSDRIPLRYASPILQTCFLQSYISPQALLEHNAKVYVATRNQSKAEEAIRDLKKITGKDAHFLKLDLADLKGIKAAAEEYLRWETRLCPDA